MTAAGQGREGEVIGTGGNMRTGVKDNSTPGLALRMAMGPHTHQRSLIEKGV